MGFSEFFDIFVYASHDRKMVMHLANYQASCLPYGEFVPYRSVLH